MTRSECISSARKLFLEDRITEEAYNAIIDNVDAFCDEDDYWDDRLPASYAEIEYDDMESEEAVIGCRFDDMNYLRYMER